MSTATVQGLGRFVPIILAVIAAAIGIYLFQSGERKVEPQPALETEAPATGVTRRLAKGAVAGFLVKPERAPVPDFAFADGEGKALKISDWKGRVVLVNLWATWCAPCRKEMPTLDALQKELGSEDFEVVAISLDRKGAEASGAFLRETGATSLKLYVEPTARILNELQAIGLPATILIDRKGNEVGRLLGPAEWNSPEALALITAALSET
jgi:thiol-disulfide isomerase/thioredoxin